MTSARRFLSVVFPFLLLTASAARAEEVCQLEIPSIGVIGHQNPTSEQAVEPLSKCPKGTPLYVRVTGGIMVEAITGLIGQYCAFDRSIVIDHEPDAISFACVSVGKRTIVKLAP